MTITNFTHEMSVYQAIFCIFIVKHRCELMKALISNMRDLLRGCNLVMRDFLGHQLVSLVAAPHGIGSKLWSRKILKRNNAKKKTRENTRIIRRNTGIFMVLWFNIS